MEPAANEAFDAENSVVKVDDAERGVDVEAVASVESEESKEARQGKLRVIVDTLQPYKDMSVLAGRLRDLITKLEEKYPEGRDEGELESLRIADEEHAKVHRIAAFHDKCKAALDATNQPDDQKSS